MSHPCEGCWLRYSSYCCGCELRLFGLGLIKPPESKKEARGGKPRAKSD